MLRDDCYQYMKLEDMNCAEAALKILSRKYDLDVRREDLRLMSAFGGGACKGACGALCGAMAALGSRYVTTTAHQTESFKELCGELTDAFQKKLGSLACEELKAKYRTEEMGCVETVALAVEAAEEIFDRHPVK